MDEKQSQPTPQTNQTKVVGTSPLPPTKPELAVQPQMPMEPKPKKGKTWLVVLLIVIVLVVVGSAVWLFFANKSDSPQTNENKQTTENTQSNEVQNEFDTVIQTMASEIAAARDGEYLAYSGDSKGGVIVRGSKEEFYISLPSPNNWSGLISLSSDGMVAAYNDFVSALRQDGFIDYDFTNPFQDETYIYLFKDNILCDISQFGGDRVFYACADITNLEAQTEAVKPFYGAYEAAYPDLDNEYIITVDTTKIEESSIEGYEKVRGGIGYAGGGGAYIKFFRVNGGEWQYGYGGQDSPGCANFVGKIDLQKAFAEDSCYEDDSSEMTTIKEHFNL